MFFRIGLVQFGDKKIAFFRLQKKGVVNVKTGMVVEVRVKRLAPVEQKLHEKIAERSTKRIAVRAVKNGKLFNY